MKSVKMNHRYFPFFVLFAFFSILFLFIREKHFSKIDWNYWNDWNCSCCGITGNTKYPNKSLINFASNIESFPSVITVTKPYNVEI